MKNPNPITALFPKILLTTILFPSAIFAQGDLTPAGAPQPTMKTLAQIEPRIDVMTLSGDANSHFLITNAGSYYLTTNLTVSKTYGIQITAAGVTLDLNGFEIVSPSGGNHGIRITTTGNRTTVRNGTLRGLNYGILSDSPYPKGCVFEKLIATGCTGIGISAGESARVIDCLAHDNPGIGIVAETGSVISGCTARRNHGAYGIYGDWGSIIKDCVAYNNIGNGSSSYGIYGNIGALIIDCISRANSNTNSPGTSTQGVGIFAGNDSTVKNCNVTGNKGDGILVAGDCLVEGNNCNGSSQGAGIYAIGSGSRIEGNLVKNNVRGIYAEAGNLIIRNSASSNDTNYVIAAGNKVGVIVSAPNSVAISGSTGGAGVGSTDPWANISF